MRSGLPRYGVTAAAALRRNSVVSAGSNGSVQTNWTACPSSSAGVLGRPISAGGTDHAPAVLNPHASTRRRAPTAHSERVAVKRCQRYACSGFATSPALAPPSMALTPSEKNGSPQGVSSLGPSSPAAIDHRDEGASAKSSQAPAAPAQRSRTAVAAGAIARRQTAGLPCPSSRAPRFAKSGHANTVPQSPSNRIRSARPRSEGGSMQHNGYVRFHHPSIKRATVRQVVHLPPRAALLLARH